MGPTDLWVTSRQISLRLAAYDGAGAGGPSVVVLHGLGAGVDALRDAVPGLDPYARLADHGFNVLALDWPGHGRSGGRRGHLTYRLAMDAAATASEQARRRWDGPVAYFGTSFGGTLAFYAALEEHGAVAAAACHTLVDLRDIRPLLLRPRQASLLPAAGWLARRLKPGVQQRLPVPVEALAPEADLAEDPRLARVLRRHPQAVRRYDLASVASLLLTPEDKPDVGAQQVPTLVAVGEADRLVPESAARAVAARLACDHEEWVLPGAGHQLLLEHPDALLPAVAAFVRRHC